jgi:RNA polymerase sigma factor (sigma-70 family)
LQLLPLEAAVFYWKSENCNAHNMDNLSDTDSKENEHLAWMLLQSGQIKGLEMVYRQHASHLYNFGMSLVKDEALVSDLIQEVFLDLWKYQKRLPQVQHPKNYLFKVFSNKLNKERKKSGRIKTIPLPDEEMRLVSPSFEHFLIESQQEEMLRKQLAIGIDKLPLRQKEVIHYLFFESLSYEESARILEINLRSVYTLAWKALKSLKKSMTVVLLIAMIQKFLKIFPF